MLNALKPIMQRFAMSCGGNIAILFGLMAIPLFLFAGGAVDFNRYIRYKAQLQGAIDSAALALSRQDPDQIDVNQFAENYVNAVMVDETSVSTPALTINAVTAEFDTANNSITVDVDAVMDTSFLRLASIETLERLPFNLDAQVQFSQHNVDVVLVTDVTASMVATGPGGKRRIDSLREAASTFATELAELARTTGQIQFGIVPYTNTVNIKTTNFQEIGGENWIDQSGAAKYNGHFFRHPDDNLPPSRVETSHWNLFMNLGELSYTGIGGFGVVKEARLVDYGQPNRNWKGCVEARGGTLSGGPQNSGINSVADDSYDLIDVPPNRAIPNSLFVPYFALDEPGPNVTKETVTQPSFGNSYIDDDIPDTDIMMESYPQHVVDAMWNEIANYQKYSESETHTTIYRTKRTNGGYTINNYGPNRSCPEPILDLTDLGGRDGLEAVLQKLSDPGFLIHPPSFGTALYDGGGGTNTVLGAAWGWRVLSPGEPFDARSSTENNQVDKILVFMTDGRNQVTGSHGSTRLADGDYTSYGYKVDFDLSRPHRLAGLGNQADDHIDERLRVLCENIKKKKIKEDGYDIKIYTATIDVNETSIQELYTGCASLDENSQPHYRNISSGEIGDFFDGILDDISATRLTN